MAGSFTLVADRATGTPGGTGKRRVLVTGAAGRIGSYFAAHAHDRYQLRLMVRPGENAAHIAAYGEVVTADLADLPRLKEICAGVDTVLHLAGNPNPSATWEPLLATNIIGTYHAFVAAKAAGCRRVIHASSIHAVSGYARDRQVKTDDPVNPGDLYGVSKAFGEALARYMAEQEGLSAIAIRIGGFQSIEAARDPSRLAGLDAFVSQRDLTQLITRCIDDERLQFAIFHGLSDNAFKRLDISDARELLGYAPEDDFAAENPLLKALRLQDTVARHNLTSGKQQSGLREELAGAGSS
jgi:UDP-glucose 4-epimerase